MATMWAVRSHRRGGPETLVYEQVSRPAPSEGEVLIEVHAAGTTPTELTWDATWRDEKGRDRTPVIPSHEVSGVVVDAGPGVSAGVVDNEVYALIDFNRNGAAAQYVVLPAHAVVPRPGSVSHVESAAVPLAALTAWQALVDQGRARRGERLFVQGAAGGVGTFVVQLGKALGLDVTATAKPQDQAFVLGLGADRVLDYPAESPPSSEPSFDVLVDTFGGAVVDSSYDLVKRGGRLVTLSQPPDEGRAKERGIDAVFFIVQSDPDELRRLADMVDNGDLRPVVGRTLALQDARAAYEPQSGPRRPGKTVLAVRP